MDDNIKAFLEDVEEIFPYLTDEYKEFILALKEGRRGTIPKQLAEDLKAREILQKQEQKAQQELNLLNRRANALKTRERKARTKRLIDRGALLESLVPCIKDLPTDVLAPWLEVAVTTYDAKAVLEQILLNFSTESDEVSADEGEEVIDLWEN